MVPTAPEVTSSDHSGFHDCKQLTSSGGMCQQYFFFNPVSTNSPPGMEMAQPFCPPAPVLGCLHGEKASPDHQAEHLLFLFIIVASYPTAVCCSEDFKPSLLPYREDITKWGYQDGRAGELAMPVHAQRLGKVQSGEGMALEHPNSTPVGGKES